MYRLVLPALLLFSSCAMLDEMVTVINPDTGLPEEVRVGDLAADAVDNYTQPAASILTTLIPNPIAGAGIGAALLAAAGAASSRLRKKKPVA